MNRSLSISHDRMSVRRAKTQISLVINPGLVSVFAVNSVGNIGPKPVIHASIEDTDQTELMPRLI